MWEGRTTWSYNTDLIMELAMYTVDFAHHLHMLVRLVAEVCLCTAVVLSITCCPAVR